MRRASLWMVAVSLAACCTVVGAIAANPPSRLAVIGGMPKLPPGKRGVVAVVAKAPYGQYGQGRIVPVVLRNNTKHPVASIQVTGTAFDSKRRLIATGQDQGIQPEVVPPGGLAIGYVYLGDKDLPAGATFKLDVSSSPLGGYVSKVDLPIATARYVNGQLVGIAKNTTKKKVSGPLSVYAACFDRASRLLSIQSAFGDKDNARPGDQVPFTIDFTNYGTSAAPACAHTLVAMRGYSF